MERAGGVGGGGGAARTRPPPPPGSLPRSTPRGGSRGRPGQRRPALLGAGRLPPIAAGATRSNGGRRRRLGALAPPAQHPRPVLRLAQRDFKGSLRLRRTYFFFPQLGLERRSSWRRRLVLLSKLLIDNK